MSLLPTFIIGGAPKCGTTALAGYLAEHPDVDMSVIKEPHFFTRMQHDFGNGIGKPGPTRSITYDNGLAWYGKLFGRKPAARARGEASTHYFSAPDSAGLIHQHVPDVKLVFLLRDPVDRLYSHYWQDVKNGVDLPDFPTLVATDHPAFRYYRYVSQYADHLARFRSLFADDQILVLSADALKRRADDVLRQVCRHIGVDPAFTPASLGAEYNPNVVPRSRMLARLLAVARHNPVTHALPVGLRRRLGAVRGAVARANSVRTPYPPLPAALRATLAAQLAEHARVVPALAQDPAPSQR